MRNYPEFHCHCQSLDSASTIGEFVKREKELETGTLTCTDHGSMGACHTVYTAAKEAKLTAILGTEGYLRDDDDPILDAAGFKKNATGAYIGACKYHHVTVHFADQHAYETGGEVLSLADDRLEATLARLEPGDRRHGSERKPLWTWQDLERIGATNATVGTGCLIGIVQRHILDRDDFQTAAKYYERLKACFKPGNFYVEVFPHDVSVDWQSGIYLTMAGGTVLNFHRGKKLMVGGEEVTVSELSKQKEWGELTAIKNYYRWDDVPPQKIVKCEEREGWVEKECRPWVGTPDIQAGCNRFMLAMAERHGDPVVVSGDSHFAYDNEKIVQDVRLAQMGDWRFSGVYSRKSSADSFQYFSNKLGVSEKIFEGWVDNNAQWSAKFKDFKLDYKPSLPTKFYPDDVLGHLGELIKKHGRLRTDSQPHMDRLRTEVELLHNNGELDLIPYFFVGEEVVDQYAKAGLLTGPGRGSAAGLLLAYLLGITHLEPLRYGLSLDRFLTLDRIKSGKLPDIDLDFPFRDILSDPDNPGHGWLFDRFGDHVCQISTDTSLKLKSAVKDVARFTSGSVHPDIEKLTRKFLDPKGVPDSKFVFGYTTDDGTEVAGSITFDKALQEYVRRWPGQWEIVQKAMSLIRSRGRHPCGHVIANKSIRSFIPTVKVGGHTVTQYTAVSVEEAGGVKMDFLTVSSLKDISDAIGMIRDRSGLDVPKDGMSIDGVHVPAFRLVPHKGKWYDVWDLPEDERVFRSICKGDVSSVFQFGTPGARGWLKSFNFNRPDGRPGLASVEDLSAFTALDRPGPLDAKLKTPGSDATHNALVEFSRRARGMAGTPDLPEFMKDMFPETLGVLVFQESLQKMYQYLTGCTGAEAEEFRGNIAKKKMDKVNAAWEFFAPRAIKILGTQEKVQQLWDIVKVFGRYAFNKSHSQCYAMIGYVCAFLKYHYPLEWWCAVLRNADKGEIMEKFWSDCGHMVDLPDLASAAPNFEIRNERIITPIKFLHGVGEAAHEQLMQYAPYTSFRDFVEKIKTHQDAGAVKVTKIKKSKKTGVETETVDTKLGRSAINRKTVQALILSGAMDSMFETDGGVVTKMQEYENLLKEIFGPKTKTVKVPERFSSVGKLGMYLWRRKVLPIYSEDVRPILGFSGIEKRGEQYWYLADGNRSREVRVYSIQDYETVCSPLSDDSDGTVKIILAGVIADMRRFKYQGDRQACEVVLDVEGKSCKMVGWPSRESNELPEGVKDAEVGSVVLAHMSRFGGRPFCLDKIETVHAPVKEKDSD